MNFTPQPSCPRSHKRGTICSRSSQLGGIQPPILLQRCWTEVGRTMVFLLWTRKKAKQIKSSIGKALTYIQEYHDMCAYQFELGYNLALFPCFQESRLWISFGILWWEIDANESQMDALNKWERDMMKRSHHSRCQLIVVSQVNCQIGS